jgi:hypothetical protein
MGDWLRPALFGAVGGLASALIVFWAQHRREKTSIAWAIAGELDGLRSRYLQTLGEELDFTAGFAEPRFNYFVVFEATASKIGFLDKEDAAEVARVYVLAKGHFESVINYFKWAREDWEAVSKKRFEESLVRDHQELLKAVPQLTTRLKSYSIIPSADFPN